MAANFELNKNSEVSLSQLRDWYVGLTITNFCVGLFAIPKGILVSCFVEHKGDYISKCPHFDETIVD